MTALVRTADVLEKGMAEGLHVGAQLYASLHGEPAGELAVGIARPGVAMTRDSMMIWWSATKASVAVAVAQQWQAGRIDLDDPVAEHIPEFAQGGKDAVTIRHVLTHTGGFPRADAGGAFSLEWDEVIARICASPIEPDWVPGRKAGYHATAGHFVLGEIVARCDGRQFTRYVREALFEPLGMSDCWIGVPPERYRAYGDRIGIMHATTGEPTPRQGIDSEQSCARCVPGGNGRGPMRELAKLYEMLLARGAGMLTPQTVEALTAKHRVGLHDRTWGIPATWSLGLAVDMYAYGRHSSPRTFGHGGAQSSVAYADPENGVVCAVVCNGMPGNDRHYERMRAISTALYEDLGVGDPSAPGREHEKPRMGASVA